MSLFFDVFNIKKIFDIEKKKKKKKMQYEKIQKIGQGTYGTVYKARIAGTTTIVALKEMSFDRLEGVSCTTIREIAVLKHVKHDNIVSLESVFHSSKKITLVFEYCACDLRRFIKRKNYSLSMAEVKSFSYQLLDAVNYLHSKSIIHRDIKPQNIFLTHKGVLKLGDFGLSCITNLPHEKLSLDVVTQWYRAPEILLKDDEYEKASDIWSIGCVIVEIITGKPLFPAQTDEDQINSIFDLVGTPDIWKWDKAFLLKGYPKGCRKRFGKGIKTILPKDCNEKLINLIEKLLSLDPVKRITARDAINHKYFDDFRGIINDT